MPLLLLALLCSVLAAIPMSVAGVPCADDFAALKAVLGDAEGDYPELKDYATYLNFLTSCDDLKNSPLLAMIPDRQPGENACTMSKSKSIAQDFCPVTCDAPRCKAASSSAQERLCADDDAGLKAAVASHPEGASFASLFILKGCVDLKKNAYGINGCTHAHPVITEARKFCPVTCGIPCSVTDHSAAAVAVAEKRNATCPERRLNRTGTLNATAPERPFCWDSPASLESLEEFRDIAVITTQLEMFISGKAKSYSTCACVDAPFFVDPVSSSSCATIYNVYLRTSAPNCDHDRNGILSPGLMSIAKYLCPLSCSLCDAVPLNPPTSKNAAPRGIYFPRCDIPGFINPSAQSNVSLPSAENCTLCSSVTVQAGGRLQVKGDDPANPATISGGDSTRHFRVFGELHLENIVLAYGFSGNNGGAILIQAEMGNAASARLLRVAILDCEAHLNGGGVSVEGKNATLILEDGVSLERNVAKTKNGGAIYITNGGKTEITSQAGAPPTRVKGHNNIAEGAGGCIAIDMAGSELIIGGRGVSIDLNHNTATAGGGIAVTDALGVTIEKGAYVSFTQNIASGMGGAFFLQGQGTRLMVQGGANIIFTKNEMQQAGFGGALAAFVGASVAITSGAVVSFIENVCHNTDGGAFVIAASTLKVTGRSTEVLVAHNYAGGIGGGGRLWSGGNIIIDRGAVFRIVNNTAARGSGLSGEDKVQVIVSGTGTKLLIERNKQQRRKRTTALHNSFSNSNPKSQGGGFGLFFESTMLISDGAVFEAKKNTICGGGGGVVVGDGSILKISGQGTRVRVQENIVPDYCNKNSINSFGGDGGGILVTGGAGARVLVESGAALAVNDNQAVSHGGGMFFDQGTFLSITGSGSDLEVVNNSARTGSGGGIGLKSGATLSIRGEPVGSSSFSSRFSGNYAAAEGGAIAFVHEVNSAIGDSESSLEKGESSCVRVHLRVEAKVQQSFFPTREAGGAPQIFVRTEPRSVLESQDWRALVNASGWFDGKQTTEYCIRCGTYVLRAGGKRGYDYITHGPSEETLMRLTLAARPEEPPLAEGVMWHSMYHWYESHMSRREDGDEWKQINLKCEDQGVVISYALFEQNIAKLGGTY